MKTVFNRKGNSGLMASKLTVDRGTTYVITHVYKKDGVESTAGQTLRFTVKADEYDSNDTDTSALIKKDVAMSGATNQVTINPSDTQDILPGKYFYSLKVKETGGNVYLVDEGHFVLNGDPTNRLV